MSNNYLLKFKKSIDIFQSFSVILSLLTTGVGVLIIKKYLDGVGLSDSFIYTIGSPYVIAVIAFSSILFVFSVVIMMALMPTVMLTFESQTKLTWGGNQSKLSKKIFYNTSVNLLGILCLIALFKFFEEPPIALYCIVAIFNTFFLLIPYKKNGQDISSSDVIAYGLLVLLGVCFVIYPILFLFKIALLIEVEYLQWGVILLITIAYCLFSAIAYCSESDKKLEGLIVFCIFSLFLSSFLFSKDTINNIAQKTGLGMYETHLRIDHEYIKSIGLDTLKSDNYYVYVKLNATNELWVKFKDEEPNLYRIPKDKILAKRDSTVEEK